METLRGFIQRLRGFSGVPVLEEDIVRSDSERSTQAREAEQSCEQRGEQQAPAPQGPTDQAPALVPKRHGHGGSSIMERFKRMALLSFKGESQPLLAES
ncbi:hypothetical protein Taro_010736 [Colocasia esculenta]|uniref:Uncharacterized protein n=1 Tax=Colocasia esculenta TaxID=4460 RepID=A0A843U462_COLES|nr:hypothetical protein [Colocasia esculenta]